MSETLEQFASDCQRFLKEQPGPAGRAKVVQRLQELLQDQEFIDTYVGEDTPSRKVLYEDSDLGFAVLAHRYEGPADSKPHDHGPTWAIYGQASGETEMTEWELVEPASEDKPGKVRPKRVEVLKPGMAHLYNEGDLHSPRRADSTRLIRIEGRNMDGVKRFSYEPIA